MDIDRTILTLATGLALLTAAPASAAELELSLGTVRLGSVLEPGELRRELAAIESEYVAYSGMRIINLRDRAPQLDPEDARAVAEFASELAMAADYYRSQEGSASNWGTPDVSEYEGMVVALIELRDSTRSVDRVFIDGMRYVEDVYSHISGFGILNLIDQAEELQRAGGGTLKGFGSATPADDSAFWRDYDEVLDGYEQRVNEVAEQQRTPQSDPYVELADQVADVHARYFGGGDSGRAQVVMELIIENQERTPRTFRPTALMRVLDSGARDLVMSTGGGTRVLQGYEGTTLIYSSEPLDELGRVDEAAVRDAFRSGASVLVALEDVDGNVYTVRGALASADPEDVRDRLSDILDAASGGN